ELVRPAKLEYFFYHLPLLVDLDRVHAAIVPLVVVLGHRRREDVVNLTQAVLENVGEADQNRKVDASENQRVDQRFQFDRTRWLLGRMNAGVAFGVDGKIAFAPTGNIIKVAGVFGRPAFRRLQHDRALPAISLQISSSLLSFA